jgi:signal transduction histidine kinase/CheY-like chemotaxis protein/HPt (histidine-containing phosphotransfer) domain-containing protein
MASAPEWSIHGACVSFRDRSICRAAALVTVWIAVTVLAGWVLHVDFLKRISPGFVAMNPVTAVAFIASGGALFVLTANRQNRRTHTTVRLAATAIMACGLLRLFSYVIHTDIPIDQILFTGQLRRLPQYNRMAPNTALDFVLVGLSLILLSSNRPWARKAGQLAATAVGIFATLALVGYLYGVDEFYGLAAFVPMALHTAAGFMVLAVGLLFLRSDSGFMGVVNGDTAAGMLARRLLPAVVLIPIGLGWLELKGERMMIFSDQFGSALRATANVLLMIGLVWWTARELHFVDLQRRAAVAALGAARDAAHAANQAKSAFLANMSHEIRTPMTAIIGYADMMLDPGQEASERLNNVNVVRRNAEHLLAIINDVLDVSKIEAGQLVVESISCSPSQIIGEVASMMRVRATERKIEFQVKLDGPMPRTIQSDPTRLRQILLNLVGNAIKFTDSGSVLLSAKLLDPANAPRPRLQFDVIDTGIGIGSDAVGRLFQPFQQAETSTSRRFGGTGLGLTISKRLAQSLGGDITVESNLGRGSHFALTIETGPLAGVQMMDDCTEAFGARHEPVAASLRLSGRILLAEDGVDNRQLLAKYLTSAGAEVTTAEDGKIAVEKTIEAMETRKPFDLILMDMRMPELDGYGATAKLRGRGFRGPIVALTAHAMAEDREKCIRSGCTDYLTKPVRKMALLEMARRYLNGSPKTVSVIPSFPGIHVDPETLDPEVREFLPAFLDNLPRQVTQLKRTLDAQNIDALGDVVHQLKGSGGLYGFDPITALAGQVEQTLREGEVAAITRDVNALMDLVRSVEGYDAAKENPQLSRS